MARTADERRRAEGTGRRAEALAAWVLRLKGYRILARNLRLGVGELDIVARRGDVVAFVEVKRRADAEEALAAIGARQRARIVRAAARYAAMTPSVAHCTLRFDALLLVPGRWPRHIRDAWRSDEGAPPYA